MTECPNDQSNGYGSYNTTHPLPCSAPGCACAGVRKDAERFRKLQAWAGSERTSARHGFAHVIIPGQFGIEPAKSGAALAAAIDNAPAIAASEGKP